MLVNAMNAFQVAKREHKENVKAQYTDKTGKSNEVTWFRASGLGDSDRKQIYKFFAHNLPSIPRAPQNLRQLENGDYVHDRYQTAWEEMGILISMEERLSSKNDEYLKEFDWELAGHYDGLLDLNIMRAHALGYVKVGSVFNEETEKWEIEVELDEAYANSIGFYDENGEYNEEYEPLAMVADIKTMNPWGFKAIKDKADVSNIGGYIDQIMSYMYFHNTPYGSIYIESKDNNAVVEVQILWRDLHNTEEDPYIYEWEEDIHGELDGDKVRVVVDSERFFGSETVEGVIPRLTRLWNLRNAIIEADKTGDIAKMREIFPQRCSDNPESFPCSWGHKTGKPSYCEFYDHCWNKNTGGVGIRPYEAVPADAIWEFNDDESGEVIRVDNRLVPEGIDQDAFATLVQMGGLVLEKFTIKEETEDASEEEIDPEETAFNEDNIFGAGGELILEPVIGKGEAPTEALEYMNDRNQKCIDCLNCGKQVSYQKLANGGTKKCPHCKHTNVVTRNE
jgi:hypothetical protein